MKQFIFFILFIRFLGILNAQILQFEPKFLYVDSNYEIDIKTIISGNKDTLFIPENVFGFLIKEIWDNDSLIKVPVIIFINKSTKNN